MNRIMHIKTILSAVAVFSLFACQKQASERPLRQYKIHVCQADTILLPRTYSATMQGKQDIAIYPQVSGLITAVQVVEGKPVKQGQTLFEIERVRFEADVRVSGTSQPDQREAKSQLLSYHGTVQRRGGALALSGGVAGLTAIHPAGQHATASVTRATASGGTGTTAQQPTGREAGGA
ncbi:MAG: biotin/lipoyl-binding protein [Paludibacteraceae bacterium]